MRARLWSAVLAALLPILVALPARAQEHEFNAKVKVDTQQLNASDKDRTARLQGQIQEYLNQTRWTQENFEQPLEVEVTVVLNTVRNQDEYDGQFVITSRRLLYGVAQSSPMLRLLDTKWKFKYNDTQNFSFNSEVFDPLLSVLDYYAYIILAYDTDSYENQSQVAQNYLETARRIANRGTNNGVYAYGWQTQQADGRYDFVNELLSAKLIPFRAALYAYHFNGLDLLATRPEQGRANMARTLRVLADLKKRYPTNVVLNRFFEIKSGEIVQTFKEDPERGALYQVLIEADPLHRTAYDDLR